MVQRFRTAVVLFCLAALPLPPALAQPNTSDDTSAQVIVKITVIREGGKDPRSMRTHQLLLRGDGSGSTITSGQRIPVPANPTEKMADDKVIASFTYQNVGLTLTASAWADKSSARVSGRIEDASLLSREPIITRSLSQSFDAYFPYGKPVRVSAVADPDGATTALEIQVDRVR